MVVDDHDLFRTGLRRLLDDQDGLVVVADARRGDEAVKRAAHLHPDVIVMDVTMPIIDGVEATRRLTAAMPGLVVIALSMHEREDMQLAMREAGASRYLTKDGPPEMLIAAIRSTVHKRTTSYPPA